jgi:hypothetical protein
MVVQYTLKLTWTAKGADPHHPFPVQARRNKAIAVARGNHVTGPGGKPIEQYITDLVNEQGIVIGAKWEVEAPQDSNICRMLCEWSRHKNVTYSGGPPCRAL